jgi:large conductance mechanosensitive channel
MKFFKEFKEFAVKGNMIDMAIGVIIGSSFGKIISSFVSDVIMPPLGLLVGSVDFSKLSIVLKHDPEGKADVLLRYGMFVNTLIDFLIVAFVIFLSIKAINKLKKPAPLAEITTKDCPKCFTTIPIKATKCPNCTSDLE